MQCVLGFGVVILFAAITQNVRFQHRRIEINVVRTYKRCGGGIRQKFVDNLGKRYTLGNCPFGRYSVYCGCFRRYLVIVRLNYKTAFFVAERPRQLYDVRELVKIRIPFQTLCGYSCCFAIKKNKCLLIQISYSRYFFIR